MLASCEEEVRLADDVDAFWLISRTCWEKAGKSFVCCIPGGIDCAAQEDFITRSQFLYCAVAERGTNPLHLHELTSYEVAFIRIPLLLRSAFQCSLVSYGRLFDPVGMALYVNSHGQ